MAGGVTGSGGPPQVGAEAVRAERAARRAHLGPVPARAALVEADRGASIIRSAWAGTALFALATALAVAVPITRIPAVVVDLALFFGGSGLFLWGLLIAARRSREDEITLWELILLTGIAPRQIRAHLLGALGLQVVVAAATCWITAALAFGWLVPLWGVAHCQLWAARYGAFGRRSDNEGRPDGPRH